VTGTTCAGLAVAGVLGLAMLSPVAAAGQMIEVGGGISQIRNPPPELFHGCKGSRAWAADARAGLRFSRAFSLAGTFARNWGSEGDCQAFEPPDAGPFDRVTRVGTDGLPYWSTDARLNFEPSSPSGNIWLKAFGGYGRMWGPDTGYWLAGGGLVFGAAIQSVIEFEWNWFSLPYAETTQSYVDGTLISEDVVEGDASRSTFRIRAGFRWHP